MMFLKAFIVGGLICVIGQLLIDLTKLTPAKILVLFVCVGVLLGGLGIYQHLIDFAGAGATVPLTGFGASLAKGVKEAICRPKDKRTAFLGNKLLQVRFKPESEINFVFSALRSQNAQRPCGIKRFYLPTLRIKDEYKNRGCFILVKQPL